MDAQVKTLEINAFICPFYLTEEFRFSDQCKCTLIQYTTIHPTYLSYGPLNSLKHILMPLIPTLNLPLSFKDRNSSVYLQFTPSFAKLQFNKQYSHTIKTLKLTNNKNPTTLV